MTVQVMIDKCENRHRRRNALSLFSLGPFQGERSRSRPIIAALGESSLYPRWMLQLVKIIFAFLNMFGKDFFLLRCNFVLEHVRSAGGGVCVR